MIIRLVILSLIISLISPSQIFSQEANTIYLLPGQGSDERLFDSLKFDEKFRVVHIDYPIPEKGSSLADYAKKISQQIDTTQKYVLIGVSLGGMIISELNEFLAPYQSIIISSAKSRHELPFRYRFQRTIPLYVLVPPKLMLAGAKFLQPIVEPDRKNHEATFKSMLASKDPVYIKRTVAMIIQWEKETAEENIIHIHGTKDHTIPFKNVRADHIIEDGSHMMTLTLAPPINKVIFRYLQH